MNRRNNRFLSDKLRYTKRTTTKREFNFIPIARARQGSGDAPENERTFALSPPKWASSPRDTPRTSVPQKKQMKYHLDISLIEPTAKLKVPVPKPGAEQEDPTINLAALRAAELNVQKQSTEEKALPEEGSVHQSRVKLTRDPIRPASNEEGLRKTVPNLPNIQSEEKEIDPVVKDAETNSNSTTQTKSNLSTKVHATSDNDSQKSGKKSQHSSRGRRSSVSSKDSKPPRSRSGSRSSRVEDSENEDPKSSKTSSSYKKSKALGGSESEGFSTEGKRSKNQDEVAIISDGAVSTERRYSRRLSGAKKSSDDSQNEDHLPRGKRVRGKSSDSEKKSTDDDRLSRGKRVRGKSSDSEKKSTDDDRLSRGKRVRGKSSDSEKKSTDDDRLSRGRSSDSEKKSDKDLSRRRKSIEVLKKFEELVATSVPSARLTRRKSSGSEKSAAAADDVLSRKRRLSESGKSSGNDLPDVDENFGNSKKSATGGLTIEKEPITSSDNSEKLTTGRLSTGKKQTRKSSSSEKPTTGNLKTGKKYTRRSGSSKRSLGGRTIGKKHSRRSSSSDELPAVASFKSRKSSKLEKSANKGTSASRVKSHIELSAGEGPSTRNTTSRVDNASSESSLGEGPSTKKVISRVDNESELSPGEGPSTRRVTSRLNNASELSAGEGPSKPREVYSLFQGVSNRSKSSVPVDYSTDDQWFSPQKPKVSNQQSGSKKGAKFKKTLKAKSKKSSGVDVSSDEHLFSPQKRKVPDRQVSSTDGEKPQMKLTKSSRDYSAKSEKKTQKKTFKDVSEEMSEEIPLQDKPLITTFAGLPFSDSEKFSEDENSEEEGKKKLAENMVNLEDIMDTHNDRLSRSYDTSRGLKVNLLNPIEAAHKRAVKSITDLDVLWNYLVKSLNAIMKDTSDEEKKRLVHRMKSFLEQHFLAEMAVQLKKKEMQADLKDKSEQIKVLTNRLLLQKQKNRQLAQKLYEKKRETSPQKGDAIMDKFENFCQLFTQFKRN